MKKNYKLLLVCDLDGTVFPTGSESVSSDALDLFHDFVSREDVCLVYMSGRSLKPALKGIQEFGVPIPNIYVGDTGTSMFFNDRGDFKEHKEWHQAITPDWGAVGGEAIHAVLKDVEALVLQEAHHQSIFKQCYYFPEENEAEVIALVKVRLATLKIKAEVVTLIDHHKNKGYLDILPQSATKEHALHYLQDYLKIDKEDVVFAGDAGNDFGALTSGYKAILVNNAQDSFKEKVRGVAEGKNILERVYFSKGGYKGMNGNYTGGVLEGLNHFGFL